MSETQYWIWLTRIDGLGSIRIQKLLERFKVPKNIWMAKKEELIEVDGIGDEIANKILDNKYRLNLDVYENYMKKNEIQTITLYDECYPKKLKELYDRPIVLYVKGNKDILNEFSLAIIGCREYSKYGEIVSKDIAYKIAKSGIVTVSGLARGIDSFAH